MSARSFLVLATCALLAFPVGIAHGQITPAAPSSCYGTSLIVSPTTGQRLSLNLIDVDLATGGAADIGVTGVSTSARLPALAIDSGGNIYGGDQNGDIWRIDAATGAATFLSSTDLFLTALAFDAADNLYGLTEIPGTFSGGVVSIDAVAGTWATVVTTSELFAGLAFDPETGEAYVSAGGASFNPDAIYTVDLSTGTETFVGSTGAGSGIPDIAFDDNADLFLVTGQGIFTGNYKLYSMDKATGAAAAVGTDLGFALVSAFRCFEQFTPAKLFVCHNPSGKPGKERTLEVDASALADHLGHGDTEGPCEGDEAAAGKSNRSVPESFVLSQNYPNPFNPTTTISFALPEAASVHLAVYNALGQEVKLLVSSTLEAGAHSATWDATDESSRPVSTGLYIYRMTVGDYVETRKMLLLE